MCDIITVETSLHVKGLVKGMEEQRENIIEYLKRRLEKIEKKMKQNKKIFDKNRKEILELKNRISDLEHKVDFAYEAFSPISMQQQVIHAETEHLREEVEEKRKENERRKEEIEELQKEAEEIKELLSWHTEKKVENVLREKESSDLVLFQELERQRIARELHDTTVQNLTALVHKIDFCTQILNSDPIRVRLELEIMRQTIKDSINDMRETIYNLRPMTFDDIGFNETLTQAVNRMQKGFDTKIVLETEGDSYPVNQIVQLTILRVVQEAVNNCKKYANANMIDITLSYKEETVELVIMDDGIGFDTQKIAEQKEKNTGFGLSIMRERINLLNGTFEIESRLGFGTEIQVNIPIK